ncbi:unnamed protein product [Camellia sinensis]
MISISQFISARDNQLWNSRSTAKQISVSELKYTLRRCCGSGAHQETQTSNNIQDLTWFGKSPTSTDSGFTILNKMTVKSYYKKLSALNLEVKAKKQEMRFDFFGKLTIYQTLEIDFSC